MMERRTKPVIQYVSDDDSDNENYNDNNTRKEIIPHPSEARASKIRKRSIRTLTLYEEALYQLGSTCNTKTEMEGQSLFQTGMFVYCEVQKLHMSANNKISEDKLIEILNTSSRVIAGPKSHPGGDSGYRKELNNLHTLSNSLRKFPAGKLVATALLCLIGTALFLASGIIIAVTLGICTPVGILGFMAGISVIAGSLTASTTTMLGIGCTMFGGSLAAKSVQKNQLRQNLELLENTARFAYSYQR